MAFDMSLMNRTRFAKLSILSADVYAKQLQCVAEHNVRADIALNICLANPTLRKSLTRAEKGVLPTLSTDGYSKCDPTLMYKILRYIIRPPRLGWDKQPGFTDITVSDDVERIRILRNKIVHRTSAELTRQEEAYIIPLSLDIAKRLDIYLNRQPHERFEAWISQIVSSSIDKELEEKYVELGLKTEELTNTLEILEGNCTLRLKSGKNLKLLLANELWEEEDKPDGIGIVAEVTGFNEDENQKIVEYLNEQSDKINEASTLVVLKKARLGSIVLFLKLLELMPEEKLYQQIAVVMKKLFQEMALEMTTITWNVDIMLFPDEFLIEDDISDKVDDDERRKTTLILDLEVNGSCVKNGNGFVKTTSDFIEHIITETNSIHHTCDTKELEQPSTLNNRGEQQGYTSKSGIGPDTMVKNLDSWTCVKKLYTGENRRDLTVLKVDSICNWEQFLMPAPTSIAILGQLMAIATKKDFSLDKQIPEGGFKFVKNPGSFRDCLVQISNSGCEAFMEAHKSMDKIRMYTMQFQENIKQVVNILINGSEDEKTEVLPGMFEEMKDDADKCLHLAEATENKFYHVMLLIDETSEASAAVKGVYEDGLKDAIEKMKLLQMEEKQIENRKQEMEDEKKRVIEDLGKAKTALDKSFDEVPGIGSLMLINMVEEGLKIATGAMNLFGQYKMMAFSGGLTALTSLCKGNSEEPAKSQNMSESTTVKDGQHQPELKAAYQHANGLHVCIEKMYEMFMENTDSKGKQEMKVDLDVYKKSLNGIKDALVKIKDEYKKSEFAKDPAVLETKATCKQGIELCEEMLKIKKKNAFELFQKVEKLKSDSKGLQLKAQVFFKYSPVSFPSAEKGPTDQKSQPKRVSEMASENARYQVEMRKKELDDARRAREKFQTEVRKMDEQQNSVLEGLSKTRIDSINFEEIQKTLKEGLIVLSQLKEQWSWLVLFFQNITSGIDVCLSQRTYKLDRRLRDGRYNVGQITRDIVLEMAASVNSVAYAVELIATAYTDISKKHLVPNTASLGELIAYDPAKEGEQLNRRRQQIDKDCKEAKAEIKALAEKSRIYMERNIDGMYERLEEQLNKLPPLPQVKVLEIKENVKKSSMSASDYI